MNEESSALVRNFKGNSLKTRLSDIVTFMQHNGGADNLKEKEKLWLAALEVKEASAQIHEIVHALGILKVWENIREDGEKFIWANLAASGRNEYPFDLVTDRRIGEFKFAGWQEGSANGVRNRQALKDLIGLVVAQADPGQHKEFFVASKAEVEKFFNSDRPWNTVLDKSGRNVKEKFEQWLRDTNQTHIKSVRQVYEASQVKDSASFVKLIDVEAILEK